MRRYEMHSGVLRIFDEELGLDIVDSFDASKLLFKSQEKAGLIMSMSSYIEGQLHGPSLFYNDAGLLISSGWYCRGNREGVLKQYYSTGNLCSSQGFVHGIKTGPQIYYYPNGSPRTKAHYKMGVLDGEMVLYWPNGNIKRYVMIQEGRKVGNEKFLDEQGKQSMEVDHAL